MNETWRDAFEIEDLGLLEFFLFAKLVGAPEQAVNKEIEILIKNNPGFETEAKRLANEKMDEYQQLKETLVETSGSVIVRVVLRRLRLRIMLFCVCFQAILLISINRLKRHLKYPAL